ncbi:MAG: penicillin-binding transpeptidase domain-containing protein [Bacillota bacterium]|nr:penicillin-binding transpeptidase domain-containing protein [Bacillota bacterium]MDD3297603.1 penicillin-binding transpeptidase domain-containing protein [Bacillota bacterium]MDD3851224.1 penicillin-binding transpeptidase domain-containing protein [Bacillota bacterium]MDD4707454.1 penicillin-binding transpeptidase domain-containing protein [Bacillota bacterium]
MTEERGRTCSRTLFTGCVILLLLLALIGRLFQIQVVRSEGYSQRAANQRMLNLPLDFSRGQFYDVNMIPLTGRERVESLVVFPDLIEDKTEAATVIAELTGMQQRDALRDLEEAATPYKLPLQGTDERLAGIWARGIMVVGDLERYDSKSIARHLIGYIDKSDNVGRSGLERLYEEYLSGNGKMTVAAMVDGSKRLIPGLGYKLINGGRGGESCHLQLTIDYHIQRAIEEIMDEFGIEGAVVVLNSESGEVAAMASRPNYHQNNVEEYLDGQRGELLNKAFCQYNLGSIFKTVVAAAALEDSRINPFETVNCPGYIEVGDLLVKCSSYDTGGHGDVDMFGAYAKSCNTFFIEMGQRVGGERIMEMAERFGLGEIVGLNPLEEQPGLIPSDRKLHKSDVCNISIGQGDIMVTPLQVAVMTSIIANNGTLKQPRVLKDVVGKSGGRVFTDWPENPEQVLSPFVAMEIRKMMEQAVDQGTGTLAALPDYGGTAGKTSSAQTGQRINGREVLHAWFTGYVPRLYPRYVITVLVENGRSGGSVAAPVFKGIAQRIMELGER